MYENEIQATPSIIRDFLHYNQVIKGKSQLTVQEYFLDLRTFFRFIKKKYNMVASDIDWDQIDLSGVDIELIRKITLADVYEFFSFCINDRDNKAASRARKASTLRMYFHYLTNKVGLLKVNPVQELEAPKLKREPPRIFLPGGMSSIIIRHRWNVSGKRLLHYYHIFELRTAPFGAHAD